MRVQERGRIDEVVAFAAEVGQRDRAERSAQADREQVDLRGAGDLADHVDRGQRSFHQIVLERGVASTWLGQPPLCRMSWARLRTPRTRLLPPLSNAARSALGLPSTVLVGDSASRMNLAPKEALRVVSGGSAAASTRSCANCSVS